MPPASNGPAPPAGPARNRGAGWSGGPCPPVGSGGDYATGTCQHRHRCGRLAVVQSLSGAAVAMAKAPSMASSSPWPCPRAPCGEPHDAAVGRRHQGCLAGVGRRESADALNSCPRRPASPGRLDPTAPVSNVPGVALAEDVVGPATLVRTKQQPYKRAVLILDSGDASRRSSATETYRGQRPVSTEIEAASAPSQPPSPP